MFWSASPTRVVEEKFNPTSTSSGMSTRGGCLLLDFANHQSVDAGGSAAA